VVAYRARVRSALYVPPFGELADPHALVAVGRACEDAGYDGLFLWDHMWRPGGPVDDVADVWVALAAVAAATTRLVVGPMVVPLARRRPQKVARESVTLDRLSRGRLVLGVGLGVDTGGELGRLGEETDARARGDALDEAIEVLFALWSGEVVHHHGARFTADAVRFLPRPWQSPRIPVWGAARGESPPRTIRRAARLDGLFPVRTSTAQLASMLELVADARGSLEGFDVAYAGEGAADELEALGVTWRLLALDEGTTADEAVAKARAGPR